MILDDLLNNLPAGCSLSVRSKEKALSKFRLTYRNLECAENDDIYEVLSQGSIIATKLHEAKAKVNSEKAAEREEKQRQKKDELLSILEN